MSIYRTFLFSPGNVLRRAEKALNAGADVAIIDLEDAVPLSEKIQTRAVVNELLNKPRKGLAYVRVNSLGSGLTFGDLDAVISSRLDGLMLPKAEKATEITHVDWLISELEAKHDLPPGGIDLMPLIESAVGLWNIMEIMMASPRVKRVAFGSADFTLDIGSEWNKDGEDILYARSRMVLASRAAGRDQPIDGVFVDIKDEEGFRKDCCLGRKLGFQGKLVIHPSQLDITNQVYSPTAQEVTSAKKVVEAFDLAEQQGLAAIQVEGKLVDYPVVIKARQILARAQSIGIL